jgi:hypothetical protein
MDWLKRNKCLLARIFVICLAVGIALDLFLVEILGVKSISLRTWIAEKAHQPSWLVARFCS